MLLWTMAFNLIPVEFVGEQLLIVTFVFHKVKVQYSILMVYQYNSGVMLSWFSLQCRFSTIVKSLWFQMNYSQVV